ncbi:histidine kinase [Aquimarina hainanensis]|uniref:Histidine kinase n=1 Tax=Aquimarina hainanensis TaxID=1578017 RepID=A0ABW5NB53_9FLAO
MTSTQVTPSFYCMLIYCLLISSTIFGQDPYHFIIGKKELGNADIYSVLHTRNQQLYVATNQGIYRYTNGQFDILKRAMHQNGNSFFNLLEDKQGAVFCNNLSGQVFKIVNDSLELYYSLPKEYVGPYGVHIAFDSQNNLVIVSKKALILSEKKEVLNISNDDTVLMNSLPNGDLYILSTKKKALIIKDGTIHYRDFSHLYSQIKNNHFRNFFMLNGRLFNQTMDKGIISLSDTSIHNILPKKTTKLCFQYHDKDVWSLGATSGIQRILLRNDSLVVANHFFKKTFISTIAKGTNQTLFLGTFREGLIVIPNQHFITSPITARYNSIRGFAVSPQNAIYTTERDRGIVLYHHDKTTVLDTSTQRNYHRIFYDPVIDFSINKQHPGLLYDAPFTKNKKLGAFNIKDMFRVDPQTALVVSSSGLLIFGKKKMFNNIDWQETDRIFSRYMPISTRCKSVVYDTIHKQIALATVSQLFTIEDHHQIKELLYKNKSINANKLAFYDGKIWVATQDHGILVFEHNKLIHSYSTANGFISNTVSTLKIKNNVLYALTEEGLLRISLSDHTFSYIGIGEGLTGHINDINVSDDRLWVLSNNSSISSIELKKLPVAPPNIAVSLDSIIVSGKKISNTLSETFSYDKNHLSFYPSYKGVSYHSEGTFTYRLEGFEQKWSTTAALSKKITYKSLPPGKYRFEIKPQYGITTGTPLTYSFRIAPPYWNTWWFYTGMSLLFCLVFFLFFKYRISLLKKKNQEKLEKQILQTDLLDTQLIALRSQMNPHFIFNALNSIQDLILNEDTENSYDYIVLFSELVRRTLNYSNQDFIELDKELEFLEIYLKLEKLRFGETFAYQIKADIGENAFSIPSLLIQPFIENALLHGLLHKNGLKKLSIIFSFSDQLLCTITDNGIGRKKAKEILDRRGNHHESFALNAIKKRLQILNKQHDMGVGYTITDLYKGELPTGTQIIIRMPYKKRY